MSETYKSLLGLAKVVDLTPRSKQDTYEDLFVLSLQISLART